MVCFVSFNKNLQKTSPRVLRRVRISSVPPLIFRAKPPTRPFYFPLQIFKCESFAYHASNDVMQAEQMADAQLKAVVQEGESRMNSFKVVVENRFSEELNPTVYPQVGFQGGGSSPRRESLNAHLFCTSEILHTFRANDCEPRNVANTVYIFLSRFQSLDPRRLIKILNQYL